MKFLRKFMEIYINFGEVREIFNKLLDYLENIFGKIALLSVTIKLSEVHFFATT